MPIQRCTFFFGLDQEGWSETYFGDFADVDSAKDAAGILAELRRAMLTEDCFLVGWRISQEDIKRDARLQIKTDPRNGPFRNTVPIFTAVDVRMESTSLYRRTLYVRGLPRDVAGQPSFNPSGPWMTRFTSFANELTRTANHPSTWGIKVLKQLPVGINITAAARLVAPGRVTLSQIADWDQTVFKPGKRVIVNAPRGTDMRGQAVIDSFPGTKDMTVRFPRYIAKEWIPGMSARLVDYELKYFDKIFVRGLTHRDTGRPFGLPVGHQRAQTLP